MSTVVEELIGFLSSASLPIKKVAVDAVRDLTGSEDGLRSLCNYDSFVLPSLSLLLSEKGLAEPAAESLVNLSQDLSVAEKMVEMKMIKTVMDTLFNPDSSITRLLVMLLVNLTQVDAGCLALLQVNEEKMQGLYLMKLVRSFCKSFDDSKDDLFDHVGSILVNISKLESGRRMLLDPKRSLLKQILQHSDSPNELRKKGVFGTIRNCCFEAEKWLSDLLALSEFLWPALLLPVAGHKVYNESDTLKMPAELRSALLIDRAPCHDSEIRIEALEAIYLIIVQEAGLRAFWTVNGPRILQVGYEDEEDPKVMEAYERVGSLVVQASGSDWPNGQM